MKLFFIIGFFSLIFLSCQKEEILITPDTQNPKNLKELSKKGKSATVEMLTITHQADNDEDVFISYKNPGNGKQASRFKIEPGQCLKFPSTHFQFIKNIKLGVGFTGITPQSGFGDEYKVVCGSILPEDEEAGHRDYPSSSTLSDNSLAAVGKHTLCILEMGCFAKLISCGQLLNHSSWEVRDVGSWNNDYYILQKSEKNTSEDCQFFEEILENPS